jgi:hypothetical protein
MMRLVEDGVAQVRIAWWSRGSGAVVAFAASELQRYVQQMSGALLDITRVSPPASSLSSAIRLAALEGALRR